MSRPVRLLSSGFTLLELLLAVAITAGIVGAVFSLFYGVTAATGSAGASHINTAAVSSSLETARRDLASSVNSSKLGGLPLVLQPAQEIGAGFMSLMFYSLIDSEAVSEDLPPVGLARITYSVVRSSVDDDYVFVREISRLKGTLEWDEPEAQELARRVRSAEVAAFDGENWHAEWPIQGGAPMPHAVSIILTCGDDDAARTLETIAVIRSGRTL